MASFVILHPVTLWSQHLISSASQFKICDKTDFKQKNDKPWQWQDLNYQPPYQIHDDLELAVFFIFSVDVNRLQFSTGWY